MKKTFSIIIGIAGFIVVTAAFTYDEPKYKNLKILPKNISDKAMDSIMHHYSISLNVGCDFCHVQNKLRDTWDMASDAKHEKLITRKMMTMTNAINAKYFPSEDGVKDPMKQVQTVTCFTCHKGEVIPADHPVKKEVKDSLK